MTQYPTQPPYYQPAPANHPQATTVLVLGILGLVTCQALAPVAWYMGNNAIREIDASGGAIGGRDTVNAGRICGIIGTALIIALILFAVFFFALAALAALATVSSG